MDLQYTGGVMEFDRFFKFSQLLLRDEFVLSYSGYVSEDILLAVGDTLRERLEDHARDGAQIRNVFSIFVELMQNIIRYGVEGPQPGPEDGEKPSFGIVTMAALATDTRTHSVRSRANNPPLNGAFTILVSQTFSTFFSTEDAD